MKVLIYPNLNKQNSQICTQETIQILKSFNIDCLMDNSVKGFFESDPVEFGDFFDIIKACDILISVGGDGTLIHLAKYATEHQKPLLGINSGRLGFLTSAEYDDLGSLKKILTGDYITQSLMNLSVTYQSKDCEDKVFFALNDCVVSKSDSSNIIDIDIFDKTKKVTSYRADGVIMATPTGSTAYLMSAGGPIIDPNLEAIAMTPVCPHSLFSRTFMFRPEITLTMKLNHANQNTAYLIVDGKKELQVKPDDRIIVKKGDIHTKFISFKEKTFYELVNEKF